MLLCFPQAKDGEKLDRKQLMQEAYQERLKEAQELERKLARLAKTMDHLERARREEEAPYLEAAYQDRLAQDKAYHEEQQEQQLAAHRTAWEVDIVEKRRLVFNGNAAIYGCCMHLTGLANCNSDESANKRFTSGCSAGLELCCASLS
eukprot:GHUV01029477.1.p1 GENE.GHUV01029477.1~~GHUV01029477.1.p1  ORF type:complete len:148 (-),score=58.55 GHUV01029477.1:181-624(-)